MKQLTLAIMLIAGVNMGFALETFAQQPTEPNAKTKAELRGTRKQLATIVFAGLAGAVLGLSTLSFHGRPQDHLGNIAIGFAIGTVAGTVYTTYKATTSPRDFYDYDAFRDPANHSREFQYDKQLALRTTAYSWEF